MSSAEDERKSPPGMLPTMAKLRSRFRRRDWNGIEALLDCDRVWTFDRPITVDEFATTLDELFRDAVDLDLLISGMRFEGASGDNRRDSFRCCVMWGETGSWKEHEFEFDLHVGSKLNSEGEWRVSHLGLTYMQEGALP